MFSARRPCNKVDGTNNYGEFKQKSQLDLDAAGYWQYVGGPDYKPPTVPKIRSSVQVQGVNGTGETVTVTVPGNETEVAPAKKKAEAWLAADKKALSIIVKAVPVGKLYIVRDCHSAHDAWHALKNEHEPANALTAVSIKQQIISYQCDSSENPVRWREVRIQLYGKLRDADLNIMPDTEFAKHLVTLMTQSEEWRYCRSSAPQRCFEGGSCMQPATPEEVGSGGSLLQSVCLPFRRRKAPLMAGKLGSGDKGSSMATGAAGTGDTACLAMGCGSGLR
ncbi:hypothetical protein B0H14DRAFT_3099917 [Mycena olivaceomarginata]|nr:hypothetical protein B0H14DRAFT_3099917 [Mycena olivaceomarginata]